MKHTMHVLKNDNESDDEPESEVIDESVVDHQHCQNLVTEQDSVNMPFTEATADEMKSKIIHGVESVYVKEETSLDCVIESSEPEMASSQGEDLLTEYNAIQSACYKEGDADDIDRKEKVMFKTEPVSDDEDNEVLAVRIKQRWQHCQNTWKQPSSETEMTSSQEDPMSEHGAVKSVSKNERMNHSRKKRRTKIKEEPVSDDEANTNCPQTVVEPVLILKIKERWQHCQSAWKQQPSETEMTSGPEEDPLSEHSSVQSVSLKEGVPSNTSEEIPEVIRPPTAVFIKQETNKVLSDGTAYNKQYYLITKYRKRRTADFKSKIFFLENRLEYSEEENAMLGAEVLELENQIQHLNKLIKDQEFLIRNISRSAWNQLSRYYYGDVSKDSQKDPLKPLLDKREAEIERLKNELAALQQVCNKKDFYLMEAMKKLEQVNDTVIESKKLQEELLSFCEKKINSLERDKDKIWREKEEALARLKTSDAKPGSCTKDELDAIEGPHEELRKQGKKTLKAYCKERWQSLKQRKTYWLQNHNCYSHL